MTRDTQFKSAFLNSKKRSERSQKFKIQLMFSQFLSVKHSRKGLSLRLPLADHRERARVKSNESRAPLHLHVCSLIRSHCLLIHHVFLDPFRSCDPLFSLSPVLTHELVPTLKKSFDISCPILTLIQTRGSKFHFSFSSYFKPQCAQIASCLFSTSFHSSFAPLSFPRIARRI